MLRRYSPALRDVGGAFLSASGLTRPGRRLRDRLSIATFHRVLPASLRAQYPLPGLAVTPDELDRLLSFFATHFTCGTLADTWERWQEGADRSRSYLAITFDDGQRDNVEHALPILRRHGLRATFFVTAGHVGTDHVLWHDRLGFAVHRAWDRGTSMRHRLLERLRLDERESVLELGRAALVRAKLLSAAGRARLVTDVEELAGGEPPDWAAMMSWDQVMELSRDHEIGSHSLSHALLPGCTPTELEAEVSGSRRLLEERLGVDVVSFCYPNGDYDRDTLDAVARAGYRLAATVRWGSNRRRESPLTLRRCDMHSDHIKDRHGSVSAPRVAWRMSGWYPGLG